MKSIKFPKDELAHDWMIEWWYFNGHLSDSSGKKYSYMHSLFKANIRKFGQEILKKSPFRDVYFSHSIITDISRKRSYPLTNQVVMLSKDSFTKRRLFINYINPFIIGGYVNCAIESPKNGRYRLKNEQLEVYMDQAKPVLFEGGKGFIDFGMSKSYYYTIPRLKTKGTINLNGKRTKVRGISWYDHQWSDMRDAKNKWNWLSIQLNDRTDIACFEYNEKGRQTRMAEISTPTGRQESARDVFLIPIEKWKSPSTKTEYPVSWRIEIPSKGIDLEAHPLSRNQEIVTGPFNYWEGPLKVSGTVEKQGSKKRVEGMAFLEVVGRPCQFCQTSLLKNVLEMMIKQDEESPETFV